MANTPEKVTEKLKKAASRYTNMMTYFAKKFFYEDVREDTEGTPASQTRVYTDLENEKEALTDILVTLHLIEKTYWTVNPVINGKEEEKPDSYQTRAKEIDKAELTIGFYRNIDLATRDRKAHRYSSAKLSKEEKLLIQQKEEAEEKKESGEKVDDGMLKLEPGDPWDKFQDVKFRIFPKGFVQKIWDHYRNNTLIEPINFRQTVAEIANKYAYFAGLTKEDIQKIQETMLGAEFPSSKFKDAKDPPDFFRKIFREVYTIKIPPEAKIEYPDGETEYTRAWGYEHTGRANTKYNLIIDWIIANYTQYILNDYEYGNLVKDRSTPALMAKVKVLTTNLSHLRTALKKGTGDIFELIGSTEPYTTKLIPQEGSGKRGYEFSMRKYPTDAQKYYTGKASTDIKDFFNKTAISKAESISNHVYCKRSYRVIVYSYYSKKKNDEGQDEIVGLNKPQEPLKNLFRLRTPDGKGIVEPKYENGQIVGRYDKERYEEAMANYQKKMEDFEKNLREGKIKPIIPQMPWENAPGMDERNMPLEVDDGKLAMVEGPSFKGMILADKYKCDMVRNCTARASASKLDSLIKELAKKANGYAKMTPTENLIAAYKNSIPGG